MSGRNCCGPAGRRWCAASSMAWRCIWQNRTATSPISAPPSRRCASCIAPASATTISPRSRTGCAAATAAPISPISSSPPASRRRGRLFRIAAYEDLRHLLKHKRSYAPDALTPKERKILARKSLVASVWLKTGKKVYRAITRGLFNFTDREGGGRRLVNDAPVLIDLIRKNPACPRYRHRRVRRSPHRRRALCVRRGRPGRAGKPAAQRTCRGKGPQAARAYPGGAGAAARCRRQAAHRDPAARRDEPDRPDRADDDERHRPRVPERHSGTAQEFARPV